MINEKVIGDKLKYLILMEAKPNFDIFEVQFEAEYDKDKLISEYSVDLKFDYLGKIDPEVYNFGGDISIMENKLREIVERYPVTPQGKIQMGFGNYRISDGMIWNFEYIFDEKYLFEMSFKIDLNVY
jgi:hypothetical protein